jgi:hypothetical protein
VRHGRRRWTRSPASVVILAAVGVLVCTLPPSSASARSSATFTWSIEPKFGADRNGDGLAGDPHNSSGSVNSQSYKVTFNACSLANAVLTIPTYRWQVDGGSIQNTGLACTLTRTLSRGGHRVRLILGDGQEVTRTIDVRDLLIVSLGDSFASGEGAPDVPGGPLARWQAKRCHRSSFAAPAVAAKAIENADPHSVVTFVHVACSGAAIASGILGPYAGLLPDPGASDLPAQIDQVRSVVGSRPINAIVVGVSANDAGFAGIVEKCIVQARCDLADDTADVDPALDATRTALLTLCAAVPAAATECTSFVNTLPTSSAPSAATSFDAALPALGTRFSNLASRIVAGRSDGGLGTPASRVLLTPYQDPTRGADGTPCRPADYLFSPLRVLPGVAAEEFSFSAGVVSRLNNAIALADAAAAWSRVPGIPALFATHGYCSPTPWVNRLQDTFAAQGDHYGILHPNRTGHAKIAPLIQADLADLLNVP